MGVKGIDGRSVNFYQELIFFDEGYLYFFELKDVRGSVGGVDDGFQECVGWYGKDEGKEVFVALGAGSWWLDSWVPSWLGSRVPGLLGGWLASHLVT